MPVRPTQARPVLGHLQKPKHRFSFVKYLVRFSQKRELRAATPNRLYCARRCLAPPNPYGFRPMRVTIQRVKRPGQPHPTSPRPSRICIRRFLLRQRRTLNVGEQQHGAGPGRHDRDLHPQIIGRGGKASLHEAHQCEALEEIATAPVSTPRPEIAFQISGNFYSRLPEILRDNIPPARWRALDAGERHTQGYDGRKPGPAPFLKGQVRSAYSWRLSPAFRALLVQAG